MLNNKLHEWAAPKPPLLVDKNLNNLDIEKARKLLEPGGPLSMLLNGYEFRIQQQQMMEDVLQAYNRNQVALIEAGTGIGKSLAYLIPAILWSAQNKERTLISTNTISLQEQLLKKDIPLASQTLGYPVKAVIVKGMSNYLCIRKLEDARQEKRFFSDKEGEELEIIQNWSETTKEGSLAALPIVPSYTTWERVCAEGDTCTQRKCPHYKKCHFFNARREAEDAQILISNHSMLFADLAFREHSEEPQQAGLLPDYSRVVLDEAHNIERIATEFFAEKVTYLPLLRWLGKLGAEKSGKLPLLGQKLLLHYIKKTPTEASSIHTRINIDLPGMRRELLQHITEAFDAIILFLQTEGDENPTEMSESKLRILPKHTSSQFWEKEFLPKASILTESLKRYIQSIRSINSDISNLDDPKLEEQINGILHEILAFSKRIEGMCLNFEKILQTNHDISHVKWIEAKALRTMTNVNLINAELDVSKRLVQSLFNKYPTTILCSATLTTNQNFDFIKQRLGLLPALLPNKILIEKVYPSPFDYQTQALLIIPDDMPNPAHPSFIHHACEKILRGIQASRGNAFVLFTSYGMLKKCHNILAPKLQQDRFIVFKQGDANRNALLENYKQSDRAVLFGTDSFWEGVDVVGEALRCVIIVKLPFKVPSEPIIEARTEAISAKGGDPFLDYAIPNAIVKFKQGFGRLIRNKQDRGCILCLDPRLIKKNYGRLFLNSLPHCSQMTLSTSDELQLQMENFYKRSYFLTKNR